MNGSAYDFIFDKSGRAMDEVTASSWVWGHPGGMRTITYTNSTTYFDHVDWLGTVRARSNVSGTSVETCTSLPFGDAQSCTGTDYSPLHYTGQELDSESNLHHFPFRQLSTTQGRWAVTDPAGMGSANPNNPQTWNQYGYATNQPTGKFDPLGLVALPNRPSVFAMMGISFCDMGDGLEGPCSVAAQLAGVQQAISATMPGGAGGTCVYANDSGTGVDTGGNGNTTGIDTNSNPGECGKHGGYWFNGSVDAGNLDFDPDSNWVGLTNDRGSVLQASCGPSDSWACSVQALENMGADYEEMALFRWNDDIHEWGPMPPSIFDQMGAWVDKLRLTPAQQPAQFGSTGQLREAYSRPPRLGVLHLRR